MEVSPAVSPLDQTLPSAPVNAPPPPRPPAEPPVRSVDDAVTAVVDRVVSDATLASSLQQEKAKVQHLINGLVSRVQNGSSTPSTSTPTVTTSSPTSISKPAPTPVAGVPSNDYRPRRLPNGPLDWTQTRNTLTLNLHVPFWVTKRHVTVRITAADIHISISAREPGNPAIVAVEKSFASPVDPDGCMWALEGDGLASTLLLELEKASDAWWPILFKLDDPALYTIVDSSATDNPPSQQSQSPVITPPNAQSNQPDETHPNSAPNGDVSADSAIVDSDSMSTDQGANGKSGQVEPGATSAHVDSKADVNNSTACNDVNTVVNNVMKDVVNSAAAASQSSQSTRTFKFDESSSPEAETTVEDDCEDEIVAAPPKAKTTPVSNRKVLTRADLPKLVDDSKAAIEKGGAHANEAAIQLATFYHYGIGVEQNDAEAARLYRKGLEGGVRDGSAAFQLGLIYNQGTAGLEADAKEAVRWWMLSAELGNAVAMFNLGVMLMNGSGCEMDPERAMMWFARAKMLDTKLETPTLTAGQMSQRMVLAEKLRKEKKKNDIPPEVRKRRKEEALETVRLVAYSTVGAVGIGVCMLGLRYWWRNRL